MSLASPVIFLLRILATLLTVAFFFFAFAILATRYVVLPHINDYRAYIEAAVTRAIGAHVQLGEVDASWTGMHPRLSLRQARVLDPEGQDAIVLPRADLVIAWRSLWTWTPELLYLSIDSPEVKLRRDARGHYWLSGIALKAASRNPEGFEQAPLLRWLLRQRFVEVRNAAVSWTDDTGATPSLQAQGVDFVTEHHLFGGTRFALNASGVPPLLASMEVRGEVRPSLDLPGRLGQRFDGRLYAEVQGLDLAAWPESAWAFLGAMRGRAAGRVWMTLEKNRPTAWNGDFAGRDLEHAGTTRVPPFAARTLELSLQGDVEAGSVGGKAKVRHGQITLQQVFEQASIPVHEFEAEGSLQGMAGGRPRLQIQRLVVDAGEPGTRARVTAAGRWVSQDKPWGRADLHGSIEYADAGAVARFMPLEVDEDARAWLRDALHSGQVSNGSWRLAGTLDDFPFHAGDPKQGQFHVEGDVRDLSLDLVPDLKPGWPPFEQLAARVVIDNVSLSADVAGGKVRLGSGITLDTGPARVHIANMHDDSVVTVEAQFRGAAQAFLQYVRESPVAAYTENLLAQASASGEWTMPLKVVAPLSDLDALSVEGEIVFQGGNLRLEPDAPELSRLAGSVGFSTSSGVTTEGLRGQLLGGPVTLRGRTRPEGGGELALQGSMRAESWPALLTLPGLNRFRGRVDYQARLDVPVKGPLVVEFESSLQGLAADLPAPLEKSTDSAWPLKVVFRDPGVGAGRAGASLEVTLAQVNRLQVQFLPRARHDDPVGIARAALGLGAPVTLPTQGLRVHVVTPSLDLDAWYASLEEFVPPAPGAGKTKKSVTSGAASKPVLPAQIEADLRVDRLDLFGSTLHHAQLQVKGDAERELVFAVVSDEAVGEASWKPRSVYGGDESYVSGKFQRVVIPRMSAGGASAGGASAPEMSDPFVPDTMPDVDLEVGDLRYGDWDLGRFELQARNTAAARSWELKKLVLENPQATLTARGSWATAARVAREREMSLDLNWVIRDAGKLLGRFGMGDVLAGGSGELSGNVNWRGRPFVYDVHTLSGQLKLALRQGRFLQIHSDAARLLGILSLQSLARTATFAPGSVFGSGFAWDTLGGEAVIKNGIASIEHFEMQGQGALAGMNGSVDFINETQNLKVVVAPKIDASAAALLAGVAINPAVGLGALVTQWLLREPLANAFTYEYEISGNWDDPRVLRVREPRGNTASASDAHVPAGARLGDLPNY